MRKRYNNGGHRRNQNRQYNNRDNNRGNNGGAPRPRKNFRALQEKFLNQAKDAMASGDRILAEYYLQHADHYFRMNQEFLEERNRWYEERNAKREKSYQEDEAEGDQEADSENNNAEDTAVDAEADFDSNSSSLPAFITRSGKDGNAGNVKVVNLQEWEE